MEHQHYTVTAQQVAQHIQKNVPAHAVVHYWYEIPSTSKNTSPTKTSLEEKVQHPQIRAFLEGISSFGGLTDGDIEFLRENAETFRENNPIS